MSKNPNYASFHLFTKFSVAFYDKPKHWNKSMDLDNNGDFKVDKHSVARASKVYIDNGVAFCMFVNKKKYNYRHIIHESTHIIDFLMEEIGIQCNETEFRAYMIEDLSVRLIKYCRKKYKAT